LVDVSQDVIVTEVDCGTLDGLFVSALIEGGEVIEKMGDRILGRVALDDVIDPVSSETLVAANLEITEELVKKIDDAGIETDGRANDDRTASRLYGEQPIGSSSTLYSSVLLVLPKFSLK
jgi:hypothetical protein